MAVFTEQTSTMGEVRVETGSGLIKELVHEHGKRNAQLKIKATHTDLQDLVTGWVDTADSGVWDIAQQAHAEAFEVDYRIEVHRKKNVDLAKPVAELGTREKVRDVAALARKGEMDKIDTEPRPTPTTEAAAPTPPADPDPKPPDTPTSTARRPRVEEGKLWELRNSDGSLNVGCWSYQAAAEFVGFAHRLIGEHNAEADNPQPVRIGQVKALADTLLEAADRAQANTRPDGRTDRMDTSHSRARQAIRSALHAHPIPWGVDPDTRSQWVDQLVDHATQLLGVAYDLFRYHETGDPR